MRLLPEDFPLKAIGPLIYGRTQSDPVMTAASPGIAAQIVPVLNGQAKVDRPDLIFDPNWLRIH